MSMRQVDIQARSVDEAVRLALEQMGRTRDQVEVQVLSGAETGSEDDEVLVRVTAREQLTGAREREIRAARESGAPPPSAERGTRNAESPPRHAARPAPGDIPQSAIRNPQSARPPRYDRGPRDRVWERA